MTDPGTVRAFLESEVERLEGFDFVAVAPGGNPPPRGRGGATPGRHVGGPDAGAVKVVATTADEWDDQLKQMFGGATYQDVLKKRAAIDAPPTKPGQGGYL